MSAKTYVNEVFLPVLVVGFVSFTIPFTIATLEVDSVIRVVKVAGVSTISLIFSIFMFGMKSEERMMIFCYIRSKLFKK